MCAIACEIALWQTIDFIQLLVKILYQLFRYIIKAAVYSLWGDLGK